MKYCSKCGKELFDEAVICPGCGCKTDVPQQQIDSSSPGFAFLGFNIPIVGLILYCVWKDSKPLRAKSAGKGALVGVALIFALWAIIYSYEMTY